MDNNTKKEVWKDIEGYEGLYKISSHGRVWSCVRSIIRKQTISKGYKLVNLNNSGHKKTVSVHRLVANAFVNNPQNKPEVNHLDEDKLNNHISNLCWMTSKENANWGTRNDRIKEYVLNNPVKGGAGGVYKSVRKLNPLTNEVVKEYESIKDALIDLGVKPNNGTLSSLLTGSKPGGTYKGYKWKYTSEVAQ